MTEVEAVEEVAAVARDRIGGTSTGFGEAISLELSVDELSLDERAGGDCFCADALDVCCDYKYNKTEMYVAIKIVEKFITQIGHRLDLQKKELAMNFKMKFDHESA